MIKQMMSSSENKQAGLGVNITKGNTAEDQNAKGIFGSILNSIQDFTKKEEDSKDAFGEGLSGSCSEPTGRAKECWSGDQY